MKDVEKTNVERNNSRKRIRRRRRWNNLYGLAVILLVLTVGITICYTFLFNISEIRVSGESDIYSAEEIVSASGINQGDNLLRLDSEECEKMILDKLLYVETAEISKKFPSSIEIKVTRCVPAFNIYYDGGSLLVSKKGKILEDNGNGNITNGLPVIQGLEPSDLTAGKNIQSGNEHKNEAFQAFVKNLDSVGENEITAIDLTDEFSIIVNYKNGMVFKMGGWNDIEYKLDLAASVMEDESVKGKKGYLTMIGTNQCSFRTSDSPASVPGILNLQNRINPMKTAAANPIRNRKLCSVNIITRIIPILMNRPPSLTIKVGIIPILMITAAGITAMIPMIMATITVMITDIVIIMTGTIMAEIIRMTIAIKPIIRFV